MRVAIKSQGAGWVIDSIAKDYRKYSRHDIVGIEKDPDVFWSIDLFSFPTIYPSIPKSCKSFVQVHHIDETKIKEYDFATINKATACIVPNKITEKVASKYIKVPIYRIPYWILSQSLKPADEIAKSSLKTILGKDGELLIGSFVKDGNGKKGGTPKGSKGPELLVDILVELSKKKNIKAVLGGYARDWVVSILIKHNIPYIYLEKYEDINSLYDCLDYYFVTSRSEGGPQSILEASYRKVKILSTDVGIAPEILHSGCICNSVDDFVDKIVNKEDHTKYNYESVQAYLPEKIISKFDDLFEGVGNGS